MIQTWQGLQGLLKGLPSDQTPTSLIEGLSDDALKARISSQLTSIDNNATLGRKAPVNPDGPVTELQDTQPTQPGARLATINVLKSGLANPAGVDMGQFHAIVAAYASGHEYTIPDFAVDAVITDNERKAAEDIARRLEAGENAPAIRAAFGEQAAKTAEQQRLAKEEEAARIAAEQAAARQQSNLETSVDAHLAAAGYIQPDKIGKLTDNQRANWLSRFMEDHALQLTAEGAPSMKHGGLGSQQRAAIDTDSAKVQAAAIDILVTGRRGDHMAEEVKVWLDSGDTAQIQMAQATLGVQVTGTIDAATHAAGTQYIQAGYPTKLSEIPGIQNIGGDSINPSMTWEAANEGRLYMPTTEELRAAGLDAATIESIDAAPSASKLLAQRAALDGKELKDFNDAERAVWVSDTREELIANVYIENPAIYEKIIMARNEVARTTELSVAAPIDLEAEAIALPVIEVGPEDGTTLEERVAANNPLGSQAVDKNIVGGESLMVGSTLHNNADAQTPDGLLVNDGPDSALNDFVLMVSPADGTMTMDEALRAAFYINTNEQQAFLGAASGTLNAPTPQDAENIARQFDVHGDTELAFNDPAQLKVLLSGVVAYANRTSIPEGPGNYVQRFINSDNPSIVAFRESIDRVASGNPILTKDQPAATPPENNNDSTTPIDVPTDTPVSELNADGTAKQTAFFRAPADGPTTITSSGDDFGKAVTPAKVEEQEARVAGIVTPRTNFGMAPV